MTKYTIHVESAGNARIVDRRGQTVAVLEDWTLFVNGVRIGEVDSYHEAMKRTEQSI
jgi:hypothetical protein